MSSTHLFEEIRVPFIAHDDASPLARSYTLTYFNAPARAFAARVCFGAAGLPFINRTMTFSELKEARGPTGASPAVPLGQLPVLTLPSGKVVTQSGAHMRFAGKKAGLYSRVDEVALLQDEIMLVAEDLMAKCPQDPDAEVKKAKRASFVLDVAPRYLSFLEEKVEGPFFFGADLSLPDLVAFSVLSGISAGQWDHVPVTLVVGYPKLHALEAAVRTHPLVVAHGCLDTK